MCAIVALRHECSDSNWVADEEGVFETIGEVLATLSRKVETLRHVFYKDVFAGALLQTLLDRVESNGGN